MSDLLAEPRGRAILILFGGCLALLTCVLTLAQASFDQNRADLTRRGITHWLPIAITALFAASLGQSAMAIAIVSGASVACLSTVAGFIVLAAPLRDVPDPLRGLWQFLAPGTLLVFLLGFRGTLGLLEAAILLGQGALALSLYPRSVMFVEPADQSTADSSTSPPLLSWPHTRIFEATLSILLCLVGAWGATRGATKLNELDFRYPSEVLAALLVGLVLAMPMVSTGVPIAMRGRGWAAIGAGVNVVYLNLCLLLPLIILVSGARQWILGQRIAATTSWNVLPPTLYPRIAWRIDAVALLMLSLLFVPVAGRRLQLDRKLGACLILAYVAYMLSMLWMAARGH